MLKFNKNVHWAICNSFFYWEYNVSKQHIQLRKNKWLEKQFEKGLDYVKVRVMCVHFKDSFIYRKNPKTEKEE